MKRIVICLVAIASLPALAAERVTATRVGSDVYKLDDRRVVVTIGCTAVGASEDALINENEDKLVFIDDGEECDIKSIH